MHSFVKGPELKELDAGLWLTAGAGVANLGLGLFLVKIGRKHSSVAIVADGKHVLTDVGSSAVILLGLFVVKWTGIAMLDPILAVVLGLALAWTGLGLVREAAGGLLDEYDAKTIQSLLAFLERERTLDLISVHHLRALRFGARIHVDAHLVMPEFWPLDRAHALCDTLEGKLKKQMGENFDVMFHSDPCRRAYCASCEVRNCAIRETPFAARRELTLEEAERPDMK